MDDITASPAHENLQIGCAGEYLVCADLILSGHIAFPSAQGLPYDVVAEINGKLYKIQVKTTRTVRAVPQRKHFTPAYLFWLKRCGRGGKKQYAVGDFDLMALVALDIRVIGYIRNNAVRRTLHVSASKLATMTLAEALR